VAAFSLLKLDASGFRAFDTAKWALTVAGMTRHATRCAAERSGWTESRVDAFILGHGESRGGSDHTSIGNRRFAYLPLPSIEARGQGKAPVAGSVRRVMLTVLDEGCNDEIAWVRRALSGQILQRDQEKSADCVEGNQHGVALLSLLPNTDSVVQSYMRPSTTWATVTPVVLPGYDDPAHYRRRLKRGTDGCEQKRLLNCLDDRIEGLIRKAIVQASFSKLMAENAGIE
jgi:CRISPR-associated protein Csb2